MKWILLGVVGALLVTAMSCNYPESTPEKPLSQGMSGSDFVRMSEEELRAWLEERDVPEATIVYHLETRESNRADLLRWQEAKDHRANVDAYYQYMKGIDADGVMDLRESEDLCFTASQWEYQLERALRYVTEYRRDEPELVTKTPHLQNLASLAQSGLEGIRRIAATCPPNP